jgi:zinc protease
MNILKLFFTFALICSSTQSEKIGISETTLENGLKVVVVPLKSNDVVKVGIIYDVGTADDPMCKIGLSHFLEHMMFKGTKNVSGERLKHLTTQYSAQVNAATGSDVTFYYFVTPRKHMHICLNLEADRMQNLVFDDVELEKERKVVMDERNMRCDSNPQTQYIIDAALKTLFLFSNYSFNGIGYPQHIKAYTKKALQKHYKKFYVPNNATILVVGDITEAEAVGEVRKAFGKIKQTHEVKRHRVIDPDCTGIKYTLDRSSKQISQRGLEMYYSISRKKIDSLKKFFIATVMLDCLCSTSRSALYQKFVEQERRLFGIDGDYFIQAFDKAFLCISASFGDNTNARDVEANIVAAINDFVQGLLTIELFEANKKRILNKITMLMDDPIAMFDHILEYRTNGYTTADMSNMDDIVQSITFEDVKEFATNVLTEKNRTHSIYVHPEGTT